MKPKYICITALLAAGVAVAQESKVAPAGEAVIEKSASGATVADQVKPLIDDFTKEAKAVYAKVRAEKDRTKQREMYKLMPNPAETASKVLSIAKSDLKSEGAEEAIIWVVSNGSSPTRKEAASLLLSEFKDSKGLNAYVKSLSRGRADATTELREVAKVAGDPSVKAYAQFSLASQLMTQNELNSRLTAEEKEKNSTEALAIFEALSTSPEVKEHSPKIVAGAEGKLFKINNLSIGCEAPDIVGLDQAGKEFKLSDYRGKVVLLDFWGIW